MGNRTQASRDLAPQDVGTLWTMRREGLTARCALLSWPHGWELRVIVDGSPLLAERCDRSSEAFEIAEIWKSRLQSDRWQLVVPSADVHAPRTRPRPITS